MRNLTRYTCEKVFLDSGQYSIDKSYFLEPIQNPNYFRCEKILSEEAVTKKFVCSLCEELVKKEGKPSTGPKKLQSNTFSATKQALDSVIKHDARISSYMDKDEKQFEAERDEREKQRIFGIDYIMALKKKRHHEMQKNKRFSGQVSTEQVDVQLSVFVCHYTVLRHTTSHYVTTLRTDSNLSRIRTPS